MSVSRTEKEQVRVHIRWMIRRDMPEVLDIENQAFEFPWTEEDFIRCLRQRNCIGMVAELDQVTTPARTVVDAAMLAAVVPAPIATRDE